MTVGQKEIIEVSITERKERERVERKALIMSKAKELLLEHGLDGVSMGDIAQKTELSKATLYLYFPSKEALFETLCDESEQHFIEYFHSQRAVGMSALESLKLLWNCYMERYGLSDEIIIISNMHRYLKPTFSFMDITKSAEPVTDFVHTFYAELRGLVKQGIDEGIFDPAFKPGLVAGTLLSIFSFVVENVAKMPKATRNSSYLMEQMKNVFEIFMRGIVCDGLDRSSMRLSEIVERSKCAREDF
jgi:AcrR family transcriptional regulator